jgi:TIR domain
MDTIFVSYSHDDADFADRLVLDLRGSEVPATYDKWLLRVGDSIIEKIAQNVVAADGVIALLCPTSVKSSWVKKELSIAMTGEIEKRTIKVLPAVIADCDVPAILSDKFYADFRPSYYYGLRQLFEALCPEFYERERFVRKEQIERAAQELRELLLNNDLQAIRGWFLSNGYALAALFGRLWHVHEAIPRFEIGNDQADFVVINGQSYRYEISLIMLGSPSWKRVKTEELLAESERLEGLLRWCRAHGEKFRWSLALRMASSYGAQQIAPVNMGGDRDPPYELEIDAKLLCGRREEYGPNENSFRSGIYKNTNHDVDIISYDRVVDVLSKIK